MTPEYYASVIRLTLLVAGAFWMFMGFLIWLLRGIIEDGDTFIFWLVLNNPYIRSDKGRLEHAIFVSKMLLLLGIPTLFVAVFLPNPILQEYGSLGILFIISAALLLRLVFMGDAQDRDAHHSREGSNEAEDERIYRLEEEGKLKD